jgi:hypothetical protein
MKSADDGEIACQQVLLKDASVFSIQWMVLPRRYESRLTPTFLAERYLAHIRRFTCSLVRPVKVEKGVEFRLLGSQISLISFYGPVLSSESKSQSATLNICGGLLVQPQNCDRGKLTFCCETSPDGVKVSLQLVDYCPILLGGPAPSVVRKWLYRVTQAAIHRLVTVRFLARFYRELAGKKICCRVVKAKVVEGEEL